MIIEKNKDANYRSLLHSRNIFSKGYLRNDGFFEIESIIKDIKSYDIPKSDGSVLTTGSPLHEMHVILKINIELKILDISAKTISAPYKICSGANFKIKSLIGETIGPGWKNKINKLIGNIDGCTHIRELLVSMATVSFQTIYGEKARRKREAVKNDSINPDTNNNTKPFLLNTCYAFDETSEVVKQEWPKYFKED